MLSLDALGAEDTSENVSGWTEFLCLESCIGGISERSKPCQIISTPMLCSMYFVSLAEIVMLSLDTLGTEETLENVSSGNIVLVWSPAFEASLSDPNLVK